jgi:hypothetical protein
MVNQLPPPGYGGRYAAESVTPGMKGPTHARLPLRLYDATA